MEDTVKCMREQGCGEDCFSSALKQGEKRGVDSHDELPLGVGK